MPEQITEDSEFIFKSNTIVFVFFDLSRPSTFSDPAGEEKYNVKYLMNELHYLNTNPKILKFLIGTNADKPDKTFDKLDAEKFAKDNGMHYFEISCLDT